MVRAIALLSLLCFGCAPKEQPEWVKTVAAYEVPLPTAGDKARFVRLLKEQAAASGLHVDTASQSELKTRSEVSPITFSAGVWQGKDDDESIASAMDFKDHLGRVWLTFPLGKHPQRTARFRDKLVPLIQRAWPDTASLPIMPNGAIPLVEDLTLTPTGYVVKPSAAAKYRHTSD
jgi:hypothetical protein